MAKTVLTILLLTFIGMLLGLGGYTFVYAKGASYLTNDPRACANCHVMNEQFDGWIKSSHRNAATCNDCHTPHDFASKYIVKGINGFNHSWKFTLGNFHEPIRITEMNRKVTEGACRYCHAAITENIDHGKEQVSCIRCHDSVGHQH
jgi:cytochrome c nitrite reductase small subunit